MTVAPLGAVGRLEHALSNFEDEQEAYRNRLAHARRRLAAYGARGETFAFEAELALKLAEVAEIDTALAADTAGSADARPMAA